MKLIDGTRAIYTIERQGRDNKWHPPNYDLFGCPRGFNADGDCWQETRVHGTFDSGEAISGLAWIRAKHPDERFRLRRTVISCTSSAYHPAIDGLKEAILSAAQPVFLRSAPGLGCLSAVHLICELQGLPLMQISMASITPTDAALWRPKQTHVLCLSDWSVATPEMRAFIPHALMWLGPASKSMCVIICADAGSPPPDGIPWRVIDWSVNPDEWNELLLGSRR